MRLQDRYYAFPRLRDFAFLFPPLFWWRKVAIQALIHQLDPPPQTLLEVGCATGVLTRRIALRFPATRILAIDASAEMIRIAQRFPLPNVEYQHRRLEEITNHFDTVVSMHVFPLLSLKPALRKVYNLLEPHGYALLTLTSPRLLTRLHQRIYQALTGSTLTLYPPTAIQRTAQALGFSANILPLHPLEGSYLVELRKCQPF